MFHNTITRGSIPLTGDDADLFFEGRISGQSVQRDASFLATLRALLGDRMGDKTLTFTPLSLDGADEIGLITSLPNTLQFIYMRGYRTGDKADAILAEARTKINGFDGYSPVEKVTQLFSRSFPVYAWSNEERNAAIILTGPMDMRKLHVLQVTPPVILPWFFRDKPITDDEKALLRTLDKPKDKEYREAIALLEQKYDMREFIIRQRLEGITSQLHTVELQNAERSIRDYEERIANAYREIEAWMRDRSDVMTRIYGLKARLKEDGGANDIIDLFLCNSALDLHSVHGMCVRFTASGYLENWSEIEAEVAIDNHDSFPYDIARDNGVDVDKFDKLLREIFLERSIHIRVYADYCLDLSGHVDTEHFDHHHPRLAEYMPNPHIERFDCLGDYKRTILECINNGSMLSAFTYCIASARSLSWTDYTVMSKFIRDICRDMIDLRCFELPDGRNVAFGEALEWAANNA